MIVVRVIPWVGVVIVMWSGGGAEVGVGSEEEWRWFGGRAGGLFGVMLYY